MNYMQSMIGKEQQVLIEKVDLQGMAHGYGEHYLPVQFPASEKTKNIFRKVMLEQMEPGESPFIRGVDQSFSP